MESEKTIFFGLEVKPRFNERVSIPLHHSFTCSITGAGKSVTERTLISRTEAKFLIIDCKTPRDYEGLGPDIPIFIDDRSDPLMIKRLLESSSRLWLRKEFPELIELCKVGKTWEGVLEATREKMKWKHPKTGRGVHPVVKEKLLVLEHLLGRLIDEMKSIKIVDALKLPHKINVVDIHGLSLGLQQLIVHSVLTKVLKEFTKVVVVIDEAHRFVPERKPSAARDAVTLLIQEGRAKNDFVWMSDQTVTGVDKDVLKQMHVWLLGCQTEKNEADRTLDQLTHDLGLKRRDIYRLKTGHFLVNTREWTKLAYLVPGGMDLSLAEKVISGQIKPEEAFKQLRRMEVGDLVWKERCEEERRIRKELEKRLAEYGEELKRRVAAVKEVEKLREEKERLELSVAQQKSTLEDVKKQFDEAQQIKKRNKLLELKVKDLTKRLEKAEGDLKLYDELQSVIRRMLPEPVGSPRLEPGAQSKLAMNLEHRELVVNVSHREETVNMTTKTGLGQILYCALYDIPKKGFIEAEMSEALAERGWRMAHSTLAPNLAQLAKRGFLIRLGGRPVKYRLPNKLRFNVRGDEGKLLPF